MLEEVIIANTAAVNRLSDLIEKGGTLPASAAATAAKPGRGRPAGSTNAAKQPTVDEVKAVAEKVVAEKGRPVWVKLITEHGAQNIAGLDPTKFSMVIAAAEVLLAEQPGAEEATDDAEL